MENGHKALLHKGMATTSLQHSTQTGRLIEAEGLGKGGKVHPRIISLGGDHTVGMEHYSSAPDLTTDTRCILVLPILRSINSAYGPISVIHFDSHLDTCNLACFDKSLTLI